ncbi:hypothetical protein FJZ31_39140 [Candidatus Poribacteria bacterium]|nr:hypothetical protein [Candidatus Poribacteria bacterium]
MSIIVPITVLLMFVSQISTFESLSTFSAKVERRFVEHHKEEFVKGTIYYQAPNKVVVEVDTPLEQVMAITDKVTLIYYPNAKKAFRIKSKNPITPPFIQSIIGAMKADYGLTEAGYTMIKHERKEETLYTYWNPPSKMKKVLGIFIWGTVDNKIVYAETQTPDGKSVARSFYRNHIKFEDSYVPLEVFSEFNDEAGLTQEHVTYSDVKFNPDLPERIVNFKIPDSIPVKEVKW